MSLCDQYDELYISELQTKLVIMEKLSTKKGFVNMVMQEFMHNEILELAYLKVNCMYMTLFHKGAYKSYDQFIKEII